MRRVVLAVFAVAVALLVPAIARSSALSAFHTHQWAAECFVPAPQEVPLSATGLVCVTPNDGFTISMGARDRPRFRYERSSRGLRDPFSAVRLLKFGQHWAVRPYWHCVSRRTGLTCWNKAGHGWWLGRFKGYRVF